jgi:cell division protein FtsQ
VREVWAARARDDALRAEVRFTARQRRRRMTWIVAGSALLLLVLGTLGVAYSPLFAVQQITVVGTSTLDPRPSRPRWTGSWDSAAAGRLLRRQGRAREVPARRVLPLEARPPHELVVRIVERTPIGSMETAAGFTLVDAAGVALSTAPPGRGHPVLTVTGGMSSPAFAPSEPSSEPSRDIRAQVTAMSATTPNDVTLTLGSGGPRWSGATPTIRR